MKRKINFIALFFLLFVNTASAQFTENAQISVLSCGGGKELFTAFGHTAIRICDTTQNIDVVFNYGIFDFDTDYFYLKFASGKLLYMLDAEPFSWFRDAYAHEGREVYEQVLNFSPQEKQTFFHLITENYKPENRYYQYDFFQDNCATRVRDIIGKSLKDRQFPQSCSEKTSHTFRELFLPYTQHFLWWRLGIDIALGSAADKKASVWDCMYLPRDLMLQLDTTALTPTATVLAKNNRMILKQSQQQTFPTLISPNWVFWILCVLVLWLSFREWKRKKYFKWFDISLFSAVGIVSLLVLFLWFVSDHSATKGNWNLLWANPLFLYVLFRLRKTQVVVLQIIAACLLFFLLGFAFLPQHFNFAFIPISITLIIRVLMLIYQKNSYKKLNENEK